MFKRKFFWVLTAALVIAILFLYGYNINNIEINPSYQTSSMHQIHLKHKDNNVVKWELKSNKATFPTGKKKVFLDSVEIKINLSPEVNIYGRNGTYEIEEALVILDTDVELTIKDTKFRTDSLKLDNNNQTITTDDAIEYSGKNFLIKGRGLFAKMEQHEVEILNNVKAIFYH